MKHVIATVHGASTAANWPITRPLRLQGDSANVGVYARQYRLLNDIDADADWQFEGTTEGRHQLVYVIGSDTAISVGLGSGIRVAETPSIATTSVDVGYAIGSWLNRTLDDPKDLIFGATPFFGLPHSWVPDPWVPDESNEPEAAIQRMIDEALNSSVIVEPTEPKEQAFFEETLGRVFDEALDEEFENGMESQFSKNLISIVTQGENIAVEAIAHLLEARQPDIEVSVEALHLLGLIDHDPTRSSRLRVLMRYLQDENIRMRDSACVAIAAIDDRTAIPELLRVLETEPSEMLQETLREVIEQLKME